MKIQQNQMKSVKITCFLARKVYNIGDGNRSSKC